MVNFLDHGLFVIIWCLFWLKMRFSSSSSSTFTYQLFFASFIVVPLLMTCVLMNRHYTLYTFCKSFKSCIEKLRNAQGTRIHLIMVSKN